MRNTLLRPQERSGTRFGMADTLLMFFDESGDHRMEKVDPDYPVFALGCVAIWREDYMKEVVPRLAALKIRHWGHEGVVLHSIDIRRQEGDFRILRTAETRESFQQELGALVRELPFHFAISVVDKRLLRPKTQESLYATAWSACIDQMEMHLGKVEQKVLIAESRGKREDAELLAAAELGEILFPPQRSNVAGLQLADLCAYPFGRKVLRLERSSRAWDDLAAKLANGWGSWKLLGQ